jgi:phage-related minor tail protein
MAGNIKGICIEFRGDTTKLDKALREVNNKTKDIDKELKQVNKALKFNPTSVELWRQKQDLLKQKIGETEDKLKLLKQQQAAMDASGVDKNSAEYQKLQREIITTESKLKTFKDQLKQVGNVNLRVASEQFKQWGNNLQDAGQKMKGLSIAAAAVVASLGAISVKAGVAADDLNTLSKVTGIGTKDLQKYSYAADLVDVSTEDIAKANQKLKRTAYQASEGSKSQAEAFEKIGVSVTDANGNLKDSDTLFSEVTAALGKMTNETERDAIAQQLMGKSAANLNPLIEDGGETYKQVADTLKKYDLDYVDQETLDAANQFNDQLDTMKLLGSVALAQVGSKLAGVLAPALEKIVDWIGKLTGWLGNLSPEVLAVIGVVAGVVAAIAPVLIVMGKLAMGISSILSLASTLGVSLGALAGPFGIVIAVIAALIAVGVLLYKNWDTIKAKANEIKNKVVQAWNMLKSKVVSLVTALKTNVTNAWNNIKTKAVNAVNTMRTSITNKWNALKSTAQSVFNSIKDKIVHPIQTAKDKVKAVMDKIKGFFPVKIGRLLSGIKTPHFSLNWGTKDFGKLGSIKYPTGLGVSWYAQGGIFDSPTIAGIGEAGPEAVVPLNKFWDKLDKMQTGETNTYNFYIRGDDPKQIAEEVKKIIIAETNRKRLAWQ